MSVYIPKRRDGSPKSKVFHYDFRVRVKGAKRSTRFTGTTGQRTKRSAEQVEDQLRLLAAKGQIASGMTVQDACDRYWIEVSSQTPSVQAQRTARLCLIELVTYFGADTPLLAITPDTVAQAATARAATTVKRRGKKTGTAEDGSPIYEMICTGKLPEPATVNRQVIEPLRRVMRRARKHWGVPIDIEQFTWGGRDGIKRAEPTERTRHLSVEEETRFWAALDLDYHPIAEIYIISGRRQSNWLMVPKSTVDLSAGQIRMKVLKKRREEWMTLTLTEREHEIVTEAYQQSKLDYLFTAPSRRKRDGGRRRPITTKMLYDALTRAFKAADIKDIRPHDFRHTFGTRLAAARVPLKDVMRAMDHSSIRSTMRYIHASDDAATKARAVVTVNKTLPRNVVRLQRK